MKSALPALTAKVLCLRPHSSLACAAEFTLQALSVRPKMASNGPSAPAAMVMASRSSAGRLALVGFSRCRPYAQTVAERAFRWRRKINAGGAGTGDKRSERARNVVKQCA